MFYEGMVEDNNDPEKMGRLKIRIFGIHTHEKNNGDEFQSIKTEDLPWAEMAGQIGAVSDDYGTWNIPEVGTPVWCFFRDETGFKQFPVYFATIPKIIKETPDTNKGFSDPEGEVPARKDESPISRLARNENINDTIIQTKKDEKETGVQCNDVSWDEPETKYNTEYPFNKVLHTRAGHIIEIDDSEGSERIHIYHKSGTCIEFFPDGEIVEKTKGDKFLISEKKLNELIKDEVNKRYEKNVNIEIAEKLLAKISKGIQIKVNQNDIELTADMGDIKIKSTTKNVLLGKNIDDVADAVLMTPQFENFLTFVITHTHDCAQSPSGTQVATPSTTLTPFSGMLNGKQFQSQSVKCSKI